jgi:hypothetical protein
MMQQAQAETKAEQDRMEYETSTAMQKAMLKDKVQEEEPATLEIDELIRRAEAALSGEFTKAAQEASTAADGPLTEQQRKNLELEKQLEEMRIIVENFRDMEHERVYEQAAAQWGCEYEDWNDWDYHQVDEYGE